MADYRPTREQQRILYNYYMALVYPGIPSIPEGGRVEFAHNMIKWALETLYGKQCHVPNCCRHTPYATVVEHVNGNKSDYRPENLRLACKSCNQSERAFQQVLSTDTGKSKRENADGSESAPEHAQFSDNVSIARNAKEKLYKEVPIVRLSKFYKRFTRIYMMQHIRDDNKPRVDEVITDVEALSGMSHGKAEEYVYGYSTSKYAPFDQVSDGAGVMRLQKRKDWNPKWACEDDREADLEADRLIIEAEKTKNEEFKAEKIELEKESQELKSNLSDTRRVLASLGFDPEKIHYNADQYERDIAGQGPDDRVTCLLCGQRMIITKPEVLCNICKSTFRKMASASRNEPVKS